MPGEWCSLDDSNSMTKYNSRSPNIMQTVLKKGKKKDNLDPKWRNQMKGNTSSMVDVLIKRYEDDVRYV